MTVRALLNPVDLPPFAIQTDCDEADDGMILDMLASVSRHLQLEASFIVDRDGGRRIVGASRYSTRQLAGVVNSLLEWPLPSSIQRLDNASPWCLPVRLSTGERYGILCCESLSDDAVSLRDRGAIELAAEMMGKQLDLNVEARRRRKAIRDRVQDVVEHGRFTIVYQAIHDCHAGKVVGYEALSRFHPSPQNAPDRWLADAALVGLRETLELALAATALESLYELAEDAYLSLNFSPSTILDPGFKAMMTGQPLARLVIEITEHDAVEDYEVLEVALADLRGQGLRLAIDDAGAGYASFRHVLKLHPEIIKLDRTITSGIDTSDDQQALAEAMVSYSARTGCMLVAEGVETPGERDVFLSLGPVLQQGYLLGRPLPLALL